jgi:nicotinamidase-related amidase
MTTQELDIQKFASIFDADPANARKVVEPGFVDWNGLQELALTLRKQHNIKASTTDGVRIGMLNIDVQQCFCHPQGELFVGGRSGNGAIMDCWRMENFILRNLGLLTGIHWTLDTHRAYAIFHPAFLVDNDGKHPSPFTLVTVADVETGKWAPSPYMLAALGLNLAGATKYLIHYCTELKKAGRYDLTIWPYHGMLGSLGHTIVTGLQEAAFIHSIARGFQSGYEVKGTHPLTESYSVLGPEVLLDAQLKPLPGAQRNTRFIQQLLAYDILIIAGQAKSHCVAWTISDLLGDIAQKDPALARKVYLLEDCTSAVVAGPVGSALDYTDAADKAFADFIAAGMHVVKSTDPIHTWPGVRL